MPATSLASSSLGCQEFTSEEGTWKVAQYLPLMGLSLAPQPRLRSGCDELAPGCHRLYVDSLGNSVFFEIFAVSFRAAPLHDGGSAMTPFAAGPLTFCLSS